MAQPTTLRFSKFKILVGDGATPVEAFSIVCGLTSKGIQRAAQTTTSVIPDCEDEDLPGYEVSDIASIKCTISGSGFVALENRQFFIDWFYSGERKNVKVQNVDAPGGDTEFEQGPAVLTQFDETGEGKGRMNMNIGIEFAEKPTLVAA